MDKPMVIRHWNYFRSLDERLNNTIQYIDHSVDPTSVENDFYDHKQKNAKVASFEFQQIIILSSVEFEDITKKICKTINPNFDVKWSGIVGIYGTLISKYPGITDIEITSDYQLLHPLIKMKKEQIPNPDKPDKMMNHITGIPWWEAYDDLKHRSTDVFESATLENAVSSVASLYVVNLYFMQIVIGNVDLVAEKTAKYFRNPYTTGLLATHVGMLPEFGGKENNSDVIDEDWIIKSVKP